jgi:CDP-paratose 2-epimerase
MKILITGSSGLIGAEAVRHFDKLGHQTVGIDNNMRAVFFGPQGDTSWSRNQLLRVTDRFRHFDIDIRDRTGLFELFKQESFDAVIHCAAQPSHDKASEIPLVDFDVNAVGTLNLLEANRQFSLESPFIFMSTNKVYGDAPNEIALVENVTRWKFADPAYINGIPETVRIDQSKHSIFGASKVAADIIVQEYGRYFGMPTCCLRGGCLTGPLHSGVELHGFLNYLIKCNVTEQHYTVYGYKAKQVRDNIHSYDVVRFMEAFIQAPNTAAVYNIGGGFENSISMREAFHYAESITGKPMNWSYSEKNREGDHICYYSDLAQIRRDYPDWDITKNLRTIFEEIVEAWDKRRYEHGKQQ